MLEGCKKCYRTANNLVTCVAVRTALACSTISRSNVVINLIGQRLETMNYTFDDVHVKWPERLAKCVMRMEPVLLL